MTQKAAPQARDFMTRKVQTVSPEMSLQEVVSFLNRHHVSNAPVVETAPDGRDRLVGFISEGDCLEYLSNEVFFGSPAQPHTVRTMMKRHPVCVEPTADVFTLASIFVSHRYRHLPVVEEGRLLGVVSRRDILKALEGYYEQALQDRDQERFPPDLHEVMNLRFVGRKA
jgi:CBS domain-containing protein